MFSFDLFNTSVPDGLCQPILGSGLFKELLNSQELIGFIDSTLKSAGYTRQEFLCLSDDYYEFFALDTNGNRVLINCVIKDLRPNFRDLLIAGIKQFK